MRARLILAGVLCAQTPAIAQIPLPIPSADTLPSEIDTTLLRRLAFDTTYLQQVFLQAMSSDYPFPLVPLARRTIAQYPHDPGVKRAMATAFASISDWSNVLVFEQMVIDADSTAADTSYFRHLFAAHTKLGEPSRVAEIARKSARQYPSNLRVLRSVYVALGDPEVQDWSTVLTFGPALLEADSSLADTAYFRQLFTAYSRLGQLEQLAALTHRLAAQPSTRRPAPAVLVRLAFDAFTDVQAWTHVVAIGKTLATMDSTVWQDRDYGLTMSMAYAALRQPRQAVAVLTPLTKHLSDDPSVWLTYAQALRRVGLVQQAYRAISRAFALDHHDERIEDAPTWLWYAQELRRAGQLQAARDALQRAAALVPNDPDVQAEQRRLAARQASRVGTGK